ncbi:hypothetical protein LCGC14_0944280 [marine sediment metagenome]|uniref:Uncharacterized protein n=1 Tax=marine sediment metagenome TaxID=412755 RepID=A0A0F9R2P5_9ZZZZ
MTEIQWLVIGTYITVFLAGIVGGSVSMAIYATKLFKRTTENDLKELNRLLQEFSQGKTRTEAGDEWKIKCVHGNSIMTECVACNEANRGK